MAQQNPFDISTSGPTSTMLTDATNNTAKANAALSAPANTANFNAADATGYDAAKMNATTYDPTKATANNWNVNSDQTVAGQVNGLISQNSPLLQQTQTKALEQANQRGLLNSSMAVGAAQSALYSAALPIAQADAATSQIQVDDRHASTGVLRQATTQVDRQRRAADSPGNSRNRNHLAGSDLTVAL